MRKAYRKKDHPAYMMLAAARHRAKCKGMRFDLVLEDISIPDYCPVLGIPIFKSPGLRSCPNSPSLDRVDNSRGYTKGNCMVISFKANSMKSNSTLEDLKKLVDFYERVAGFQSGQEEE